MKLSKQMREKLLEDLRFTHKKMREAQDPRRKMYYFSIPYTTANRILNIEFDRDLLFLDFVVRNSYQTISNRVNQIYVGGDDVVPLADDFFERLTASVKRLEEAVRVGRSVAEILKDIAILAYSTTGNGLYLVENDLMTLPEA